MLKSIKSLSLFLFLLTGLNAAELGKYIPLKRAHLPAVYKDLETSIKKLEKSKDKKLLSNILKVYVSHHQFDKTYYPYELLAPFYGKNKKMIIKELSKFKKSDRELAKKNLDTALNEFVYGNG
jgi:3-dehydroquinate dehydratase